MKKQLQLIMPPLLMVLTSLIGYGQNVNGQFDIDGYAYRITSLNPPRVEVVDYTGSATEVTILATVRHQGADYQVTAIGDLAFDGTEKAYSKKLTSVTIPDGVTSIGFGAFANNLLTKVDISNSVNNIDRHGFEGNQLTEFTIPNSLTSIKWGAFARNRLTGITIPGSVTTIEMSAFQGNRDLRLVTVEATDPPSLQENAFADRSQIDLIVPVGTREGYLNEGWTGFRSIIFGIFTDNDIKYGITAVTPNEIKVMDYTGTATAVTIPPVADNGQNTYPVTAIGNDAFKEKQLTGVTIPNTVTTIGEDAFWKNQLTGVVIPTSVTSIGQRAFSDNQLTGIIIPGNVENIGEQAFYNNPGLGLVTVEATDPPSLHENAFAGRGRIDLIVPVGTREDYLNEGWTGFRSITFGTFTGNDIKYGITSVNPNEVKVMDYTGTATAVTIPPEVDNGQNTYPVTAIGNDAFKEKQLTGVTIPNTVTTIGEDAFWKNQLTGVVIPTSVTSIGQRAFSDNQLTGIIIPGNVENIGEQAFYNNPGLGLVTVEATDPPSLHENAFAGRGRIDLIVPVGTREDYLNEGWTGFRSITFGTFTGNDIKYGITSVNPNEVKVMDYIGSATAVEIPETVDDNGETYTVTAIGANAFSDNPDLTTVKIEAAHLLALHENAFADRGQINVVVPIGMRQAYLDNRWYGFGSITEEGRVLSAGRNIEFRDLTLYPNPARDKVHIDIDPRSGQELKQVNIYTMTGAYLYAENGLEINTGRLSEGMYLFEIVTKTGDRSMRRVIIQ